jgi:hypothetical protein
VKAAREGANPAANGPAELAVPGEARRAVGPEGEHLEGDADRPPRVSVVIPVYNRASTIGWTLDSVLAQTFRSYEVIVVDDGSADDSAELVAGRYPQARVLRLDRNRGVAAAVNCGVRAARGELIAFLDSDDLWSPDKLALQVEDLERHSAAVLSFTDITYGRSGIGRLYSRLYPIQPERLLEQTRPTARGARGAGASTPGPVSAGRDSASGARPSSPLDGSELPRAPDRGRWLWSRPGATRAPRPRPSPGDPPSGATRRARRRRSPSRADRHRRGSRCA